MSTAGLVREDARRRLLVDLMYHESERPIQAQLFGNSPEEMYDACQLVKELGFDGIDINMGCPDKAVCKQGAGSSLILNPELAQKIILAAKRAVSDSDMPVSVKTRIGYNNIDLDSWLPWLLDTEIDALTLHLRTKKEMSLVPAHWTEDVIGKASYIVKHKYKGRTLLIGNGDIMTKEEGINKASEWNLDGIMIGRGIFGNPWLFSDKTNITALDRLKVLVEFSELYNQLLFKPGHKSIVHLKKHFKSFVNGFEESKAYRVRLTEADSIEDIVEILNEAIEKLSQLKC